MITFPSPEESAQIIDEIRSVIGRETTFVVVSGVPCSTCTLDPTTGTSVDSFCPECGGLYYKEEETHINISGHVHWIGADELKWYGGGQIKDGDCEVQIKHTPEHLTIIDNTKYVIVDGRLTEIKSVEPRGVPVLNRIILVLREGEKV